MRYVSVSPSFANFEMIVAGPHCATTPGLAAGGFARSRFGFARGVGDEIGSPSGALILAVIALNGPVNIA